MNACIHAHMRVYTHICVSVCMNASLHVCTHVHMHYAFICMQAHTYVYVYAHACCTCFFFKNAIPGLTEMAKSLSTTHRCTDAQKHFKDSSFFFHFRRRHKFIVAATSGLHICGLKQIFIGHIFVNPSIAHFFNRM